jgi:hypothetical protein
MTLLFAFLIGFFAGLRSLTAPAATDTRDQTRGRRAARCSRQLVGHQLHDCEQCKNRNRGN